jgi:hypothetical protein
MKIAGFPKLQQEFSRRGRTRTRTRGRTRTRTRTGRRH